MSGAQLAGARLAGANLTGVVSGGIVGKPASLPQQWQFRRGYLLGPGANLSGAGELGAAHQGSCEVHPAEIGVAKIGVAQVGPGAWDRRDGGRDEDVTCIGRQGDGHAHPRAHSSIAGDGKRYSRFEAFDASAKGWAVSSDGRPLGSGG